MRRGVWLGIGAASFVAISWIAYFVFAGEAQPEYVTEIAQRDTLRQTVMETGVVKGATELTLSFPTAGIVTTMAVEPGDRATSSTELARLDTTTLELKESEALANVAVMRAQLQKLEEGSTATERSASAAAVTQAETAYQTALAEQKRVQESVNESIAQAEQLAIDIHSDEPGTETAAEQAVAQAEVALANAQITYQQAMNDAREDGVLAIDQGIATAATGLTSINRVLTDDDAEETLSILNESHEEDATYAYNTAATYITAIEKSQATISSSTPISAIISLINQTSTALNTTLTGLNATLDALDASITSSDLSQAEIDAFVATITTRITSVSSGLTSIENAKQSIVSAANQYETAVSDAQKKLDQAQAALEDAQRTASNARATAQVSGEQQLTAAAGRVEAAKRAWETAQAQHESLLAPARSSDIILARAQIQQAEAALAAIRQQISDNIITAPSDGIVAKTFYREGERAQAGAPAISFITEGGVEVEVDIAESDITKIATGDLATITFDAFDSETTATGTVMLIEPAATVIADVVYYKVTVFFTNNSSPVVQRLRAGMTANVTIHTEEKPDVIIIPSRAVIRKNGSGTVVRVRREGTIIETPVTTGLRGDGGMIEITSGIAVGDEVVLYTIED